MEKRSKQSIPRSLTVILQAVIVLIGIITIALLLIGPHFEGRNTNATLFQIYFNDPFLAYVYVGSIPFFVALFQAFKLLGYIGQNKVFSQAAVDSVKTIKYCAFITASAIVAAGIYIRIAAVSSGDDPAGALMLGFIATFVSIVIGTGVAVFEKTLQSAVDIKSENDSTV